MQRFKFKMQYHSIIECTDVQWGLRETGGDFYFIVLYVLQCDLPLKFSSLINVDYRKI